MTFWLIVLGVVIAAAIVFFILAGEYGAFWLELAGPIAVGVAVILITMLIIAPLSYREFEQSFIRQQELYESFELTDNDYTYVMNILEANQELIDYQTRKELYGFASLVPDSIMELKPIGFGR